jgi:triphosphoribosyl-dephospho-CoA synthase
LTETAAQYQATDRSRLLEWDRALKANGINPGTSADLTVATLFLSDLCETSELLHEGAR